MRPYYEHGGITIYHADCRDVLSALPPADLVLTDPPYGIGISDKNLGVGRTTGIASSKMVYGPWDKGRIDRATMILVLASGREAIVWGGNYYADYLPPSQGWLVWDKRGGLPTRSFADVELAWTSYDRASRLWTSKWDGFIREDNERRNGHPTQKPLGLFQWCLDSTEARTIIDPFMGGGTTLHAAKNLNRKAIGIDDTEAYCEIAANRLSQNVLDFGDVA